MDVNDISSCLNLNSKIKENEEISSKKNKGDQAQLVNLKFYDSNLKRKNNNIDSIHNVAHHKKNLCIYDLKSLIQPQLISIINPFMKELKEKNYIHQGKIISKTLNVNFL